MFSLTTCNAVICNFEIFIIRTCDHDFAVFGVFFLFAHTVFELSCQTNSRIFFRDTGGRTGRCDCLCCAQSQRSSTTTIPQRWERGPMWTTTEITEAKLMNYLLRNKSNLIKSVLFRGAKDFVTEWWQNSTESSSRFFHIHHVDYDITHNAHKCRSQPDPLPVSRHLSGWPQPGGRLLAARLSGVFSGGQRSSLRWVAVSTCGLFQASTCFFKQTISCIMGRGVKRSGFKVVLGFFF